MSFNLRAYVRKRVFDMLSRVRSTSWKILIVDDITLRIINSSFTLTDFKDRDVPLIEQIKLKRQPFPHVIGIYFLSPTPTSIQKLIDDFSGSKQYSCAHVYFTSHVTTELVEKIKFSALAKQKHIKSFVEINLDFTTLEKGVFSLQYSGDYRNIFTREKVPSEIVRSLSTKIFTVFMTIRERPLIRYDSRSEVCCKIAKRVNRLCSRNVKTLSSKRTCVLFLCDRKIDLVAPLLHEFTYQSLACDILGVRNNNKYIDAEKKTRVLDERDPLWVKYRHFHLLDLGKDLARITNKWSGKNKGLETKDNMKKEELARVMHKLPKFSKENEMFKLHTDMVTKINNEIKNSRIIDLATKEQNLVTGEEFKETGIMKLKKPYLQVTPKLVDPGVSIENKVRLLLLYFITFFPSKYKSEKKEKKRLEELKGLYDDSGVTESRGYTRLFGNFELFFNKDFSSKSIHVVKRRIQRLLNALKISKGEEKEQIIVSRYVTKLNIIMKDLLQGSLSEEKFPYVEPPGKKIIFEKSKVLGKKKRFLFSLLGAKSSSVHEEDEEDPRAVEEAQREISSKVKKERNLRGKQKTNWAENLKKQRRKQRNSKSSSGGRRKRRKRKKKKKKKKNGSSDTSSSNSDSDNESGEDTSDSDDKNSLDEENGGGGDSTTNKKEEIITIKKKKVKNKKERHVSEEEDEKSMSEKKREFGRKTQFDWENKKFEEDPRKKLFVFSVGGVCYSEIRDFYNHLENFDCGGAIGGTTILTPQIFLHKIEKMSDGKGKPSIVTENDELEQEEEEEVEMSEVSIDLKKEENLKKAKEKVAKKEKKRNKKRKPETSESGESDTGTSD